MFKVTQRSASSVLAFSDDPEGFETHRRHPAELEAMDVDEGGMEAGPSTLPGGRSIVSPGEVITSSKEFMR